MDSALIDRIARAVLYEGYVLYPYRPSSLKNSKRWTFGILYPEVWIAAQTGPDRSDFRVECILCGYAQTKVSLLVRFLQMSMRSEEEREWQEGIEREVKLELTLGDLIEAQQRREFAFAAAHEAVDRGYRRHEAISGEITIAAVEVAPDAFKLTVTVRNTTELDRPDQDAALMRSLASAHAAIAAMDGEFISMTDPMPELEAAAAECENEGVWPVLVGQPGVHDTILASPIILPDYPEVAPESAGDLYDATEIEEILTLRILTLTDEEKAQVRGSDERARSILERAESLPAEHLMRLHGTIRGLAPLEEQPVNAWDPWNNSAPVSRIPIGGSDVKAGDRVRLRPKKKADIFDSALEGRIAIIEAIEQDFENNFQLAVVLEDDPGRDLGEMRQAGHRFFFSPSEVEPVAGESRVER